jgi:fucose permease
MRKPVVLIIFASVQIVGLLCSWFSHHPYSSASAWLWGTGFITLFPGNFLGSWLIEKLFWESHLPRLATDLLIILAVIAINSILWFAVVSAIRLIISKARS